MTILEKLHTIETAKCIYDIHYCRAGVGFKFFYPKYVRNDNWRTGLSVDKYYSSFEKAVEGEYNRLK